VPGGRGTIPAREKGTDMKKWYKLDNAAKLFPSVTSVRNSSVFRLAAILDAPIEAATLQAAVDAALQRFPSFAVTLRTGLFWNYLDRSESGVRVREETDYPCHAPNLAADGGSLVRVLYYNCRLSLETHHSVSDGGGAVEFLKAILANYLGGGNEGPIDETTRLADSGIRTAGDDSEATEDSFSAYYEETPTQKRPEPNAFRITGTPIEPYCHRVTHGVLDSARLNALAKGKGATITAYLAALLSYSVYRTEAYRESSRKPVIVSVPVNLRKAFPSRSRRNFFGVVNVGAAGTDKMDLDALVDLIGSELREKTSQESLRKLIAANVRLGRSEAARWVPVHLKALAIRQGFRLWGERKKTISLSNLGNVDVPEPVAAHVRHLEFALYPTPLSPINCGVCSLNGKLTVTFLRTVEEDDCVVGFFRHLATTEGLGVTVYESEVDTDASPTGATAYPKRRTPTTNRTLDAFLRAWLFLSVAAVIVTVAVNVFTFSVSPTPWSAVVCAAIAYGWITIRHTITSRARVGDRVFAQLAALSAFLVGVDAFAGFTKWSTTYVIPFLSMGATVIIAAFALAKRRSWHDYGGFLLSSIVSSLLPIAFVALGLTTATWTGFVSALFSSLVVAWLIIFGGATFRAEVKKRFHS